MAKSFLNRAGYPLGLRNNNPGNIRPGDNWQGMIGTNGGFVVFEDIGYGIRALGTDLRTKINNGYNTIEKIISRYAPAVENNTLAYIASVVDDTGLSQTRILKADGDTIHRLIRAIINHENGNSYAALISDDDINEGMNLMSGGAGSIIGPVGFGVSTALLLFAVYLLFTMPQKTRVRVHPGY